MCNCTQTGTGKGNGDKEAHKGHRSNHSFTNDSWLTYEGVLPHSLVLEVRLTEGLCDTVIQTDSCKQVWLVERGVPGMGSSQRVPGCVFFTWYDSVHSVLPGHDGARVSQRR